MITGIKIGEGWNVARSETQLCPNSVVTVFELIPKPDSLAPACKNLLLRIVKKIYNFILTL